MNYDDFVDAPVLDKNGEKIGTLTDLYFIDNEDKPEWATVRSGLFGISRHFIPLNDVHVTDDGLVLENVEIGDVKNAPSINDDDETAEEDDERLSNYYRYKAESSEGRELDANVEPMPNVELSEKVAGDLDNDEYAESADSLEGNAPVKRRLLRRYVVKKDGKKWATDLIAEEKPLDE